MRNIAEDVKLGKVRSEYNKREEGLDPGKEKASKIPLGLGSAAIFFFYRYAVPLIEICWTIIFGRDRIPFL
ncbi:hypothetical protein EHQ13_07735 [Leptospira gomenensis]|uniref:Uncharacterized protein n=1 Tax=Leptospira gomenensis TaxID=2484974 RepID=A0A5F1YXY1_9LEPT|nr:hypothetical protein EHQ17_15640 [Leptospira gomenensis]TGK42016.1 hypothetical protein EHQ07_15055 [Leptospira gomenensis]TGK64545.1 hypothetical protein EHQ13_07735 [Leptospira gomenensis]